MAIRFLFGVALAGGVPGLASRDTHAEELVLVQHAALVRKRSSVVSSTSFGCAGAGNATSISTCGFWGDPHRMCTFGVGCSENEDEQAVFDGRGWHWLARSKDQTFSLQGFFRPHEQPPAIDRPASLIALAGKFGHTQFQMMKSNFSGQWWEKWSINGTEVDMDDLPRSMSDGTFMKKYSQRVYKDSVASGDPAGACIENPESTVSLWAASYEWVAGTYTGYPIGLELEMDSDMVDTSFGLCNSIYTADNSADMQVGAEDVLISEEDQAALCELSGYTSTECVTAVTNPPKKLTAKEMCEQTGRSFTEAQQVCAAGQGSQGFDAMQSCVYDVCASPTKKTAQSVVDAVEGFQETVDPQAVCQIEEAQCDPCDACKSAALSVDLSKVTQNNLGGMGPDSGVEEVRYSQALMVSNQMLDIVLTASSYSSPNPQNGEVDNFGKIGLGVGAKSSMKFEFVNSQTQEPVNLTEKFALTIYDIDQDRYGAEESITFCRAAQAYISSDSELVNSTSGRCISYSSTQHGIGFDNPRDSSDITTEQMARSVTFMFDTVSAIDFTFSVGKKTEGGGGSQRFILFAFKPTVPCGNLESTAGEC